jgi:hypothetical protein
MVQAQFLTRALTMIVIGICQSIDIMHVAEL